MNRKGIIVEIIIVSFIICIISAGVFIMAYSNGYQQGYDHIQTSDVLLDACFSIPQLNDTYTACGDIIRSEGTWKNISQAWKNIAFKCLGGF